MTDIVEAMAQAVHEHRRRLTPLVISFGWYDLDPEDQRRLMDEQRAAIRACHAAGGLVLREVPGETIGPESVPWRYGDSWNEIQDSADDETLEAICSGYADGHNAAIAAVRAAAVDVGEPPHE